MKNKYLEIKNSIDCMIREQINYNNEYPHTCNWETDLSFLIKRYVLLNGNYETLLKIYTIIEENIVSVTIEQLEKWLNDGTFENILTNSLDISRTYETTLKMIDDLTLKEGQKIQTLGYYNVNDEGSGLFLIKSSIEKNDLYIKLKNGMYAVLIHNGIIKVNSLGLKHDDVDFDNSEIINKVLNYIKLNSKKHDYYSSLYDVSKYRLIIKGNLYINNKIVLKDYYNLNIGKISLLAGNSFNLLDECLLEVTSCVNCDISTINLNGRLKCNEGLRVYGYGLNTKFKNFNISYFNKFGVNALNNSSNTQEFYYDTFHISQVNYSDYSKINDLVNEGTCFKMDKSHTDSFILNSIFSYAHDKCCDINGSAIQFINNHLYGDKTQPSKFGESINISSNYFDFVTIDLVGGNSYLNVINNIFTLSVVKPFINMTSSNYYYYDLTKITNNTFISDSSQNENPINTPHTSYLMNNNNFSRVKPIYSNGSYSKVKNPWNEFKITDTSVATGNIVLQDGLTFKWGEQTGSATITFNKAFSQIFNVIIIPMEYCEQTPFPSSITNSSFYINAGSRKIRWFAIGRS